MQEKKKLLTAREIPRLPACVVRGTDEAVSENVLPSLGRMWRRNRIRSARKEWKVSKECEITRCDTITDLGRKGNKRVYWEPSTKGIDT